MIRLFLSVDCVGSTLYKAAISNSQGPKWVPVFEKFYANFPIVLNEHVSSEFRYVKAQPAVAVWKFLGDEVILVTTPTSPEDVTLFIRAQYTAMAAYEAANLERLPLQLKGTAWLATFPDPNIEIPVPDVNNQRRTPLKDFIGPDIDLGFRIGKFATPSAVATSLTLAQTVLDANNADMIDFYLVGKEPLKGVLFGRPYPIIWALPAGAPPNFMPWEIEDNPLVAKAIEQGPASRDEVRKMIDDIRLYLDKMQGARIDPIAFDRT